MSFDAEKLAALSAKELDSLESNVRRLVDSGTAVQVLEAARLIPLIEEERATRKPAAAAPKAPRVKKAAASKTAKKKKVAAEGDEN